jgi:hypothetical protein
LQPASAQRRWTELGRRAGAGMSYRTEDCSVAGVVLACLVLTIAVGVAPRSGRRREARCPRMAQERTRGPGTAAYLGVRAGSVVALDQAGQRPADPPVRARATVVRLPRRSTGSLARSGDGAWLRRRKYACRRRCPVGRRRRLLGRVAWWRGCGWPRGTARERPAGSDAGFARSTGTGVAGLAAVLAPGSCPAACQELSLRQPAARPSQTRATRRGGSAVGWSIWTTDDSSRHPGDERLTGRRARAWRCRNVCPARRVTPLASCPPDPAVQAAGCWTARRWSRLRCRLGGCPHAGRATPPPPRSDW